MVANGFMLTRNLQPKIHNYFRSPQPSPLLGVRFRDNTTGGEIRTQALTSLSVSSHVSQLVQPPAAFSSCTAGNQMPFTRTQYHSSMGNIVTSIYTLVFFMVYLLERDTVKIIVSGTIFFPCIQELHRYGGHFVRCFRRVSVYFRAAC